MKWFIPGNVPSSKNGKRWTGKYLISSKTVMKYRKDTANAYKKPAKSFIKEFSNHELPVTISFKFFRWITDDNCEFIIPAFEKYEYNKENPGVEIKIIKQNGSKTKNRIKKTKRS